MVQASKVFIILSILVSIVFLALTVEMSYVACTGAWVSSLGIARWLTTTGICISRTPAAIEAGETPSTVIAASESRRAWASAVTHLSRTEFQSWLSFNIKGSRGSRSSSINTCALKSLRRASSNIFTCEYSANTPFWIIMWLMLLYSRIKAFRPTFQRSCFSQHTCSKWDLVCT